MGFLCHIKNIDKKTLKIEAFSRSYLISENCTGIELSVVFS